MKIVRENPACVSEELGIVPVPYVHPQHQTPLVRSIQGFLDPERGELFPLVDGIPRFCPHDNYSESFGFQWDRFDLTQLDCHSGSSQSEERFYAETGWDSDVLGRCSVLEVGSGAGRFTEVFLRTTSGTLSSVDYSSAVAVNRRNNAGYGDRLQLAQASIYALPFGDDSFDKVFCLGVLQHTPYVSDSIAALIRKTKIGGEIVVDFYPIKGWYTKIHSKYLLRPLTKRLPKSILLKLISFNIAWMIALFDLLCRARLSVLTRFIPITDLRGFPDILSPAKRREWAIMDTFDGLSPRYDNPQRVDDVVQIFRSFGCNVTFSGSVVFSSGSAAVVRAVKVRRDQSDTALI